MKITVIGTGYVGLVIGTGLAENGHQVTCIDRDTSVIDKLNAGKLPIHEPGLEELVWRNVEEERLRFDTDLQKAVGDTLLVFICVGTPIGEDGNIDDSEVFRAAEDVARSMTGYRILVNKSTCAIGRTEGIRERVRELTEHPFDVVVNPEFLKEGAAVDDFLRPDRIIVGCEDVRVMEIMKELYGPFLRTGKPLLEMDLRSAEMTKFATNAMLAVRINMMNELAGLCEAYGGDINRVREGVAADSRIGQAYLFPGLGLGGSCLPKDVEAGAHMGRAKDMPCRLLEAALQLNSEHLERFINRILMFYNGDLSGACIALWGASFKPRTDDIRGAPALHIIDALLDAGAEVVVFDPVAGQRVKHHYGDRVALAPKAYNALEEADGLVICTEWREFHRPDYQRMGELMRRKVIFDGRNLYTPKTMADLGFKYFSVGRAPV